MTKRFPVSQPQSVAEETQASVSQLNIHPHLAALLDRREPEKCNGLSLSTVHNTKYWYHCTPSPHALALGCACTGPLSSPFQVLQSANGAATMKAFSVDLWAHWSKGKVWKRENEGSENVGTGRENKILYKILRPKCRGSKHEASITLVWSLHYSLNPYFEQHDTKVEVNNSKINIALKLRENLH